MGVKAVAAIALGSNLESSFGDREANLEEAVRLIRPLGEVTAVSSFYDTEPVGFLDQPRFLNAALLLETELEPVTLLRELLVVERAMGRERVGAVAKGPRVIDLDLLLYVDAEGHAAVMETEDLVLPHPEMQARRFVLDPLGEIAPEMVHPVSGLTVREMLDSLRSDS
ncbi:2-amino-4-hydroxy-6-hydroxymethyldihydropteridine diphosphokinase [Tunturiibacter gelidoferens]|uniref:2-amino-4-hydroxy-6-hydroxymethyldihydropteridine diphosphokinase n=1 Tax=Tunturiibacter gelidiferens TaxID=3069689 RepID=A0ACC5P1Q8_9BACT|nr:2-amino-4-hydroxy-6-hydroxymethyldihydropteridine diphosphokinase [Edaphobacter lichenicola]